MKIVVCGGGTVGHIAPVLAVVDALRAFELNSQIHYIGGGGEAEAKLVAEYGLGYSIISSGKFRRYGRGLLGELKDVRTHGKNAADAIRFARGIRGARKIIKNFGADVVFCKGGYVTVPVGIAANKLKVPLVLHESDAEFGISNKTLAKRAKRIAVGFPLSTYTSFSDPDKLVFSGNPVRKQVIGYTKVKSLATLNLPKDKPVIFIFGGSQGSAVINESIFSSLEILCQHYCIIHQTGKADIERARFLAHNLTTEDQGYYHPYEFLHDDMGLAYGAADVVVGRASAGTIAEIAANKKAALLIPNIYSANAHQQKNADILSKMGAVRVLSESDLSGLRLLSELDRMVHDKKAMQYLQSTVGELYNPESAQIIAKTIIQVGRNNT
jgi:UDP-N-acetylglucosamine--N-acetylmuramyl-(pentapeptide) pyrophosphoryl-undecaprenol N-acetylglucosamine transferase